MKKILLILGLIVGLGLPVTNSFATAPSMTSISQLNLKFKTVMIDADTLGPVSVYTKKVAVEVLVTNDSPYTIDNLTITSAPAFPCPSTSTESFFLQNMTSANSLSPSADGYCYNQSAPVTFYSDIIQPFRTLPLALPNTVSSGDTWASLQLQNVKTTLPVLANFALHVTVQSNTAGVIFSDYVFNQDDLIYDPNNNDAWAR